MKIFSTILLLSMIPILLSCFGRKEKFPVVPRVDLARYAGTWYEIARFPHSFEKGLVCVTADYTLNRDGTIKVVNRGRKEGDRNKISEAKASGRVPDPKDPARLKVTFFWPFSADYYILELDEKDYSYALVSSSSRDYLWILSRTKILDEKIYSRLVKRAADLGFETARLIRVEQNCE